MYYESILSKKTIPSPWPKTSYVNSDSPLKRRQSALLAAKQELMKGCGQTEAGGRLGDE